MVLCQAIGLSGDRREKVGGFRITVIEDIPGRAKGRFKQVFSPNAVKTTMGFNLLGFQVKQHFSVKPLWFPRNHDPALYFARAARTLR